MLNNSGLTQSAACTYHMGNVTCLTQKKCVTRPNCETNLICELKAKLEDHREVGGGTEP